MNLPIQVAAHGAVLCITLHHPARRNALTPEMLCRLADAVVAFAADDALRVAVITGSGDQAFCAGGDLARTLPLLTGARPPEDDWDRRVLQEPQVMAASGLRDHPLHKPVIAALNGSCMAAGFELMLGTDIRIAAEHALFGLPEVQRGLLPFAGSMARLPRQVPQALAMELLLTGEPIDAATALRIGLVNRVLPGPQVLPAAMAMAERIAANGPLAVQAVKRTVLGASGQPLAQAYALEDEARRLVLASDDAREGPRAFIEKRPPRYTGR
ncbi:enoyl-CoA hydratase/isomerase family protein [Aquincola sp. J276]|uniref:enoyl-CoA hydratase/isomerase family protein n=1 Tax=Aquincola sp. J276 TaxID=2898432 RepID=UPI0021511389|nr:enoyl-CoA hydratase-related protein [Aquincola sp. J276]MCR5869096.1 enoyl-CoA hydratase-related protein [Aquincola sp. J276]